MSVVMRRSDLYTILGIGSTGDFKGQVNYLCKGRYVCFFFCFFFAHNSAKSGRRTKLKHLLNPLIKPRRMIRILFCFVNAKVKVDPEVKVRSHPFKSWIELRGSRLKLHVSIREISAITLVPFSTLSQFDRK